MQERITIPREDLLTYKRNQLTCYQIANILGCDRMTVVRFYDHANIIPYIRPRKQKTDKTIYPPHISTHPLSTFVSDEAKQIVRGWWG